MSVEQEQLFLGAILVNNDALAASQTMLRPEYFAEPIHQLIFEKIVTEINAGRTATPLTIAKFIGPEFQIDARQYLLNLAADCGVVFMAETAAEIFQQFQRRELIDSYGAALYELQSNFEKTAEQIAAECNSINEVLLSQGVGAKMHNDYEVGCSILENMKVKKNPFSTGLRKLDECMDGGLYPGKSYGFAARKKVGKTILASTISLNLAESGARHLFICGEMSPEEIQQRNLARVTGSFPSAFRSDYGDSADFQRKIASAVTKSKKNIIYRNAPGLTFTELQQIIPIAVLKYKITGFILDYWQLVGGKRNGQNSVEHLDEVAQWIANISRKLGIWSITMAQINQEGNTRGGEGIRLAFDQVYQINREDVSKPQAYLQMMDTRYTAWQDIGTKDMPGWFMNEKGPYFEEV